MPKDSLVINGFNGGLNIDASPSDLISDGRGQDQLAEIEQVYTDQQGKVVAKYPDIDSYTTNQGLSTYGTTSGGTDLLIHNNILNQANGLYKLGNDVVFSGAGGYQAITPDSGTVNPTTLSNHANGVDISFNPVSANSSILFKGKNSTVLSSSNSMVFGVNQNFINSDFIRFSGDTDEDGKIGEGGVNFQNFTDTGVVEIGFNLNITGASTENAKINTTFDSLELDTFAWSQNISSSSNNTLGLRFRVGKQFMQPSTLVPATAVNGFYGINYNIQ